MATVELEVAGLLTALGLAIGRGSGRVINRWRDSAWKKTAEARQRELDDLQESMSQDKARLQERIDALEKERDDAEERAARARAELANERVRNET